MAQHNISINGSTAADDDLFDMEWRKFRRKQDYAEPVFIWIVSVIEIPVMILTLIGLCFIIKSRPAASVFVSHLIRSDLIQIICMLIAATTSRTEKLSGAYNYSLIAGLYFMACVAFERYLLVSHPVWYKSQHSLKLSCFVSVIVWFVPLIFAEIYPPHIQFECLPYSIACLIPYPIIILCFAGTWRDLSHLISPTALKRKLIFGSLFLVLLTYTFIILPFVIVLFIINYYEACRCPSNSSLLIEKSYFYAVLLLRVNPLADCLLYLFIRPDVGDLMKSVRYCCRRQSLNHNQDEHSVVNAQNSCSTVVCCISDQTPASYSLNT